MRHVHNKTDLSAPANELQTKTHISAFTREAQNITDISAFISEINNKKKLRCSRKGAGGVIKNSYFL